MTTKVARTASPTCPLRPGEPCMLCQPGGPESCGLVYLVMTDPVLREELTRRTEATASRQLGGRPVDPSRVSRSRVAAMCPVRPGELRREIQTRKAYFPRA